MPARNSKIPKIPNLNSPLGNRGLLALEKAGLVEALPFLDAAHTKRAKARLTPHFKTADSYGDEHPENPVSCPLDQIQHPITMTTKELLKSPLPRRIQLIAGAHYLIPGSTKGGPGKTTTIYTTAAACRMLGLPYLIANFDDTNDSLQQSLGKDVVVSLNAETPDRARRSMSAVSQKARLMRALMLLDLPGAANSKTSQLIENIHAARILERCESLTMICPIKPDKDELEGAVKAMELFEPTKVLLRAWKPGKYTAEWKSFGIWDELKQFPVWECENWTASQKSVFTRSGEYAKLPPVPELARYLAENADHLDEVELLDVEDAVIHIEHAAKIIYHHLLREITEPIPTEAPKNAKLEKTAS